MLNNSDVILYFQMSGLGMTLPSGQSPMPFSSQDSGSNHGSGSGDGVLLEPSPEKPVTTARTPTERKRKRKTTQPPTGSPANPNLMSGTPIGNVYIAKLCLIIIF